MPNAEEPQEKEDSSDRDCGSHTHRDGAIRVNQPMTARGNHSARMARLARSTGAGLPSSVSSQPG